MLIANQSLIHNLYYTVELHLQVSFAGRHSLASPPLLTIALALPPERHNTWSHHPPSRSIRCTSHHLLHVPRSCPPVTHMLALIPTSTTRLMPIVAQRAPPDAAARIRTACAPDARTSLYHQRVPRSHAFLRRSLHRCVFNTPRVAGSHGLENSPLGRFRPCAKAPGGCPARAALVR